MEMLVVIKARDPAALSSFYARLGLSFDLERHGKGPDHYASQVGLTVFEIYPRTSDTDSTVATRLGFGVPDLDVACARALEGNGRLVRATAATPWGRRAVIADPEGHIVEIVERAAAGA